ncbi:MAG: sigma-70 family RNA polymerase sigma factor [Actinomycetota bacterium]|nr:sigma-70 family RNA polymerase sigma factor [Actinomycetota bacterium]
MTDDRLGELYRAHGADALRLAFVLTGSREAAEDITQDAFVRIGRKIFGLKDPDHERAYLFRTVINLSRSRGRKLQRERNAIAKLQPPSAAEMPGTDETWTRLLTLPARQRAALFFRYYLDQSETTSAEALNCSTSALKSLVNRGLKTLRQAQGDER